MKLLHKNTISGVSQLMLTAGLTFFSIPLFIKMLGTEAYGAFSIVTLAGNLNIFANLGLNAALLKFLSIQGKSKESDHDIIVTFGLLLLIMIPISILAINQQHLILQGLLKLPNELYERVTSMFKCVVIANLLLLLGQTCTTILDSQERMYLTNFYQLIYSVLYWGGLIVAVSLGYDMAGVGIAIVAAALIWFIIVLSVAMKVWGSLQLDDLKNNFFRISRKQISFSSNVYAAGLMSMLFEPMTKILVARLIGIREVGYMEIAYKVRSQLWSLVTKVVYPTYPNIAKENNVKKLSLYIGTYQTKILLIIIPFITFFNIILSDVLNIWIPKSNFTTTIATMCISTAFLLNSIGIPIYYFLMSHQHVKKTVLVQMINAFSNFCIALLTYQKLGIFGFILSNSLAILSSLGLCLYYQKKYFGNISIDTYQLRTTTLTTLVAGIATLTINTQVNAPWTRITIVSTFALIIFIYNTKKFANFFKLYK